MDLCDTQADVSMTPRRHQHNIELGSEMLGAGRGEGLENPFT